MNKLAIKNDNPVYSSGHKYGLSAFGWRIDSAMGSETAQ